MTNASVARSIGPLLRRVRLNDGQSLARVAGNVGQSEHGLARLERGAEVTVTVLLRWCAALELAPAAVIRAASAISRTQAESDVSAIDFEAGSPAAAEPGGS